MGHHYEDLGAFERNFIQRELNLKSSRRKIASRSGGLRRRLTVRSGAMAAGLAHRRDAAAMMRPGLVRRRRSGGGADPCGLPRAALCATMCLARYARTGRRSRFRAGSSICRAQNRFRTRRFIRPHVYFAARGIAQRNHWLAAPRPQTAPQARARQRPARRPDRHGLGA
jgi:hypothetical protein